MVGLERAIVTEIEGTTRDALESVVAFDGSPFRLVDTAGLRTEAGRIEQMGIEVAERYLAAADVVPREPVAVDAVEHVRCEIEQCARARQLFPALRIFRR